MQVLIYHSPDLTLAGCVCVRERELQKGNVQQTGWSSHVFMTENKSGLLYCLMVQSDVILLSGLSTRGMWTYNDRHLRTWINYGKIISSMPALVTPINKWVHVQ
uniref:Uncharacterized protein n=1 Tax=Anguilla anguilla TaxID=7936 RepID=A0A0E9WW74_ANGAN